MGDLPFVPALGASSLLTPEGMPDANVQVLGTKVLGLSLLRVYRLDKSSRKDI